MFQVVVAKGRKGVRNVIHGPTDKIAGSFNACDIGDAIAWCDELNAGISDAAKRRIASLGIDTVPPMTQETPKPTYETLAPELIALSTLLIGWNRAKRKGDKAGLIASGDCLAEYIDSIRYKGL